MTMVTPVVPWISLKRVMISPSVCSSRSLLGSSAKSTSGSIDKRARDDHPLLLAGRQLPRVGAQLVRQPHHVEQLLRPLRLGRGRASGERRRQGHILENGERRQQAGELEDEADALGAQARLVGVRQLPQVVAIEEHLTGSGAHQTGGDVQQGGLARAGTAGDHQELALWPPPG